MAQTSLDAPHGASNDATSTDAASSQSTAKRALAIVALCVMILAMVGGAWMLWRQFAGPSESAEIDIGTAADRYTPLANRPVAVRANLNKDGINPAGIGFYRVQNGEFFMNLAASETSFAPIRLLCNRQQMMSQEQRQLLALCAEAVNAGSAKTIGLTPDQVKKLAEIRKTSQGGMKLEEADREKLRTLWKAWIVAKDPAAKTAAQEPLLASMKEIGTRSLDPTRQQYADLASQTRKIVSNEQFAKYRQLRAGQN